MAHAPPWRTAPPDDVELASKALVGMWIARQAKDPVKFREPDAFMNAEGTLFSDVPVPGQIDVPLYPCRSVLSTTGNVLGKVFGPVAAHYELYITRGYCATFDVGHGLQLVHLGGLRRKWRTPRRSQWIRIKDPFEGRVLDTAAILARLQAAIGYVRWSPTKLNCLHVLSYLATGDRFVGDNPAEYVARHGAAGCCLAVALFAQAMLLWNK